MRVDILNTSANPDIFIGRVNQLSQISSFFSNHKSSICYIYGDRGIGKTALSLMYYNLHKDIYNGLNYSDNRFVISDYALDFSHVHSMPTLFIIEHLTDFEDIQNLESALKNLQNGKIVQLIIISDKRITLESNLPSQFIELTGLAKAEIDDLIQSYIKLYSLDMPASLSSAFHVTNGNPSIVNLIFNQINDTHIRKVTDVFYLPSVLDKHGNPITSKNAEYPLIKSHTLYVNGQTMRRIAETPALMHSLTPRQFEEMAAELYQKLGYTVALTKQTRDGGKDIYLAHNTDIGSFLFLVECKKYDSAHPIGVEIIRHMCGVQGLEDTKVNGSIIATTSHFTQDAKQFVQEKQLQHQISLHDFNHLSGLLKKAYS